jgi:hypothetical protein
LWQDVSQGSTLAANTGPIFFTYCDEASVTALVEAKVKATFGLVENAPPSPTAVGQVSMFLGGIRGPDELVERVNTDGWQRGGFDVPRHPRAAHGHCRCRPDHAAQSTWFDPKRRLGFFLYTF